MSYPAGRSAKESLGGEDPYKINRENWAGARGGNKWATHQGDLSLDLPLKRCSPDHAIVVDSLGYETHVEHHRPMLKTLICRPWSSRR